MPTGDKSIAFVFYSVYIPVIVDGQYMTLFEAIGLVAAQPQPQSTAQHTDSGLQHALWGHQLYFDEEQEGIQVVPDADANLYYQPADCDDDNKKYDALGVFANDLAYSPDINEKIYLETQDMKNILQIVWEVELVLQEPMPRPFISSYSSGQQQNAKEKEEDESIISTPVWMLKPVKPVVVARRDVIFTNNTTTSRPQEVGVSYSWLFWIANSSQSQD
jgi:hypothetical protein